MNSLVKFSIISALFFIGCAGPQQAEDSEETDTPEASSPAEEETAPVEAETEAEATARAEAAMPDEESDEDELFDRRPDEEATYDASEIYGQICVTCHGERGDGKGLETELFGFDTPAEEWTNGPTVDGILRTLEDGVHGSSMQAFPNFHDIDRVELAEYILDLREALREE